MRLVLAFGLLFAFGASADAAKMHHRHARPDQTMTRPAPPVDPRYPPVLEDQTPRPDDPSRRGSG